MYISKYCKMLYLCDWWFCIIRFFSKLLFCHTSYNVFCWKCWFQCTLCLFDQWWWAEKRFFLISPKILEPTICSKDYTPNSGDLPHYVRMLEFLPYNTILITIHSLQWTLFKKIIGFEDLLVGLVVFYVPSTARSFRDGTTIYCPLRRRWSSVFTLPTGNRNQAVAWQSITQLLHHTSTAPFWRSTNYLIQTRSNIYI